MAVNEGAARHSHIFHRVIIAGVVGCALTAVAHSSGAVREAALVDVTPPFFDAMGSIRVFAGLLQFLFLESVRTSKST